MRYELRLFQEADGNVAQVQALRSLSVEAAYIRRECMNKAAPKQQKPKPPHHVSKRSS